MDKRSIIFVISLSLSLFAVNLFFQYINRDEMKKWHEQQKAKVEKDDQLLKTEISERTAKASSLPLVELYTDFDGSHKVATGVISNGAVVTLSWAPQQPEELYFRKKDSTEPLKKLRIATQPEKLNHPTLYTQDDQKLLVGNLPTFGRYDLQLVTPDQITLAEYQDGNFQIPLKKGATPPAIALIRSENTYLPVGYYDGKKFTLLDSALSAFITYPKVTQEIPSGRKTAEQFYVLQNDYQQLVFSNYGGALAEINLPLRTEKNQKSVVKEVGYDREMVEDHPQNAYFPAHSYFTPGMEEHTKGALGGYSPLIRRDLIETGDKKSVKITPQYYALNILSEYPEVAQLTYEVKSFDKNRIVFEADQGHRRITKTFSLADEAPYVLDVAIKIEGDSRGLWLSSGIPEVALVSGAPTPTLKLRTSGGKKSIVEELKLPKDALTVTTTEPDWITTTNGFFALILDPLAKTNSGYRLQNVSGTVAPSRLMEFQQFQGQNIPGYMVMLPIQSGMKFRIFAGPLAEKILNAVDKTYSDPTTGYNPDYISVKSYHGWFAFISEPFAKFMGILMQFFYQITGSWGFSIILLTIALRLMLYPLNAWSTKSMLKMQEIAPKVQAVQEKHKKDPKKAQLEVMNIYRESGANPISGCFPIIIQLPFLIGMFGLLKTSFALRGAGFIPGWIDDLSAPDVLFSWNTPIFFIGNQFHLLPFLLGGVMLVQQRFMSSGPKNVNEMTEQQRQAKTMGNMMAIVFTLAFYHFPSGLNIYWLSSMILGILQQWWTQKRMKLNKEKGDIELKVKKVKK